MIIFNSIKSGFLRTIKSWQGVLLAWFILLILVSFSIIPLRGGLRSAFGNSLITQELTQGFNLEAYLDLGPSLKSLISSFFSSFWFVMVIGFVVNALLTAGLFGILKKDSGRFSAKKFLENSAENFLSFFIISFIISLLIVFLSIIIIGIPLMIIMTSNTIPEKGAFITGLAFIMFFLVLLPVMLIAADFSRAKMASGSGISWSRSLGYGFISAIRHFWSSYPTMLLLIIAQIILGLIAAGILPGWTPVREAGVFLLFVVSQLLFAARLLLKTWRYASFTALMEATEATNPSNL